MQKLPTIHQLANHGSTACQKWQEGKKSAHQTWLFLRANKKLPGVKFTCWTSLCTLWISLCALWINFLASQYVSVQGSKVSALTNMFPHPQVNFHGVPTKLNHIKSTSPLNIYICGIFTQPDSHTTQKNIHIYAEFLPKWTAIVIPLVSVMSLSGGHKDWMMKTCLAKVNCSETSNSTNFCSLKKWTLQMFVV